MAKMCGVERISLLASRTTLMNADSQTNYGLGHEFLILVKTFWSVVMNLPVAITTVGHTALLTLWEA